MCRCIQEKAERLKEMYGFEYVIPPVEVLSGMPYIEFIVKEPGKKEEKNIMISLTKCPFCGEDYLEEVLI